MNKIKQLPQDVISKIAAGEVIERPVYAVKELVENALDAGADSIIVHVEESGLKRITVIDNGEGMSEEDLKESFKPHTTSKLSSAEALSHIASLGFRGEALSSIAAISRLTIASRRKVDTVGRSISVKDGMLEKESPVGMAVGTTITVENLFHSVPARKKFLKSLRTEFRFIADTMMHFAFSHPQVHFVLTHNGKTIFDLPKTDDVLNRISFLLGKDVFTNLLPITFADSYVTLSGYFAKPQITAKSPYKQYLFVNNRKINDKAISSRLKAMYGTLIEKQSYPVGILFLTIPHEIVDINVHPRKEEVRFMNAPSILQTIEKAITQMLVSNNLTFHNTTWEKAVFLGDSDRTVKPTGTFAGKLLKEQKLPWQLKQKVITDTTNIVQIHDLYLLAGTTNGMVLIDQHAAHERIMYEQYAKAFQEQKMNDSTSLLTQPYVLEVSFNERELLLEHIATLETMGFEIEHFKNNTFLIRSVPKLFHDRVFDVLLKEMLEDISQEKSSELDTISKKMLAYLACRSAIKAGDKLTKKQAAELVRKLEITDNNAACPHGRPTKVAVDLDTIHRMFKRK